MVESKARETMEYPPLQSPSWSPSHLKGQIDNRYTDPVHRSERDLVPKAPVLYNIIDDFPTVLTNISPCTYLGRLPTLITPKE